LVFAVDRHINVSGRCLTIITILPIGTGIAAFTVLAGIVLIVLVTMLLFGLLLRLPLTFRFTFGLTYKIANNLNGLLVNLCFAGA
jgi:hypothetical protein